MIDWLHWHNEPLLVGGIVFVGWLWAILAGPLRARLAPGEPYPRREAWFFYSALGLFYLAVGSPLDQIGERFLFSAHMGQHLIIMYPVPVLALCGVPAWMIDTALDRPGIRRPLRVLFTPLVCALLSTLIISMWHAPWAYEAALQDKVIHVVEHLMFFGASMLFWWPVLSPSRAYPASTFAGRMLYLFAVEVIMTPLFAYVTFSDNVLYPTYEYAPRLVADFSAADDQLLAGTMMKLTSMGVSLLAFGVCFFRWAATHRDEK